MVKGDSYAHQIFANDPIDAKIKWIKEFDFNVVYGIPKNIEEIKNNILSKQTEYSFTPQALQDFDSVCNTDLPLGEKIGRVTIVATQTNIYSLPYY